MKRLLKLFSKKPNVEQTDFEKAKEALKPTNVRTNPSKPFTRHPNVKKRGR